MTKSLYTDEYVYFRKLLRRAREAAGLTQTELAGRLNKPQSYIWILCMLWAKILMKFWMSCVKCINENLSYTMPRKTLINFSMRFIVVL